MIIEDEALLDEFRTAGQCELCGKDAPRREPHHAFARGLGGGSRLDVRVNLVAVSAQGTFVCHCHRLFHDGFIPRRCVLAIIALREGMTIDAVEREVYRLRRER